MRAPTTSTTNKYNQQNITSCVRGNKLPQQKQKTAQKRKNNEREKKLTGIKLWKTTKDKRNDEGVRTRTKE